MVKYANLSLRKNTSIENVGDWVQIFAIDHIYRQMGIPEEDIVRIGENELSTYRGDRVVLPLNFPMVGIYDLSPDIYPVYLGVSMVNGIASEGLRMKSFGPVGCRDHHTYEELNRYGIDAYHGGCLTITLPKRKETVKQTDVYVSGVSDELFQYLPEEIRIKAKRTEHVSFGEVNNSREYAEKVYNQYRDTASLVITSKIHCAQPCLAMGIPVIFLCKENSFRYDVVSNYVKIHTMKDIIKGDIDWTPEPIDVEDLKHILIQNATERLQYAYDSFSGDDKKKSMRFPCIKDIDAFFAPSSQYNFTLDMVWAFQDYIQKRYQKNDVFEYGVWGITQFSYSICEWIGANYPGAHLGKVIDNNKTTPFLGIMPVNMEAMRDYQFPIFMTIPSMVGRAKEIFEEYNVEKYIVNFNGLWIEDGNIIQCDGNLYE